jgi:hypothetical protein
MAHKTFEELNRLLQEAAESVSPGARYAHYKHPHYPYIVTGFCVLEATDEVAVKYASVDHSDVEFVRALEVWLETVTLNGKTVPRFTKIG